MFDNFKIVLNATLILRMVVTVQITVKFWYKILNFYRHEICIISRDFFLTFIQADLNKESVFVYTQYTFTTFWQETARPLKCVSIHQKSYCLGFSSIMKLIFPLSRLNKNKIWQIEKMSGNLNHTNTEKIIAQNQLTQYRTSNKTLKPQSMLDKMHQNDR